MHTLFILVSLALALAACTACTALLRLARSPSSRRIIEVAGLFIPTLGLTLLGVLTAHFITNVCFLSSPPADAVVTQVATTAGVVGMSAALLLNLARAIALPLKLNLSTWEAPAGLQLRVRQLAVSSGVRPACVPAARVCVDARPWALVAGLVRPRLVVSSGLLALLDEEELDAVLCHELLHIRRGDLWWTMLCGVLRDLTWFLPHTRRLYAQMLVEQEVECDDAVVGEDRRLALASALARVWQQCLEVDSQPHAPNAPRGALGLVLYSPLFTPRHSHSLHSHSGYATEARVRRLLEAPAARGRAYPHKALVLAGGLLGFFILAQLSLATAAMQTMQCTLHGLLGL